MSEPVARFLPWRHLTTFGFLALALGGFCAWLGRFWVGSYVVAGLFVVSGAILFLAAFQPVVEIHDRFVRIVNEMVPWNQIRRLDRTRWISPLLLYITLVDDRRMRVFYPANLSACAALLRQLRRNSRESLIDGVAYSEYWGELFPQIAPPSASKSSFPSSSSSSSSSKPTDKLTEVQVSRRQLETPKYRLLRQDDEDEVIRLYQRLKSVGHIDPKDRSAGEN